MKRILALCLCALLAGCGDDDGATPTDSGPRDSGGGDAGDAGPTCTFTSAMISGATMAGPGEDAIGGNGDLEVSNDVMRVVFAAVDRPAQIAASGGTIVDMHLLGSGDQMNELSQIAGPAQSLQVRYTAMSIAEQDASHVVVEATGHVQQMPLAAGESPALRPDPGTNLGVTTRYTIRCGEPAVHLVSTLTNNTATMLSGDNSFGVMDVMLWGGRGLVPFCPTRGTGDKCPPFEISHPLDGLVESLYVGSAGSTGGPEGTFALYTEDTEQDAMLEVHSDQVSSVGYFVFGGLNLLAPGESTVFKRAIVVGGRADAASATDFAIDALAAQGRFEAADVTGSVTMPAGETLATSAYDRPMVMLATPYAGAMPLDPTQWTPVTMARVDATGHFSARVPAGPIAWELRMRGRPAQRGMGGMAASGTPLDLGALALDPAPTLDVHVRDGAGAGLVARVIVKGAMGTPDPELGPEGGGSPAHQVALTDGDGDVSLRVPAGTYDVYATHGMQWSIAKQTVTVAAAGAETTLAIEALPVLESGFITADFHVHSGASFDSSLPPTDRVMAFLAEGVDAIVSTEHDVIFDYAPALATVEAALPPSGRGKLRTFTGLESTTQIPQGDFVHTIGHYNAFPLSVIPGAHKNGAPDDEYHNTGELYELLRALPGPATRIVQLNHARSSTAGRVWLGYFDACGFDPTMPITMADPCFSATGLMGTRAWDADAMEVINGQDGRTFIQMNRDWLALLLQAPGGRLPVGTANSDSHRLVVDQAGFPVTLLHTTTPLGTLDDAGLVAALRSGSVAGGVGMSVWAWAHPAADADFTGTQPGTAVAGAPAGAVVIDVRVAAPPWVPIDEIRVRVNGEVVRRLSGADLMTPTDPYGTTGVVRFAGRAFDVTSRGLTSDAIVTVEAGFALPRVGDIDGDGIIDATDNDGDGDVDMTDVAMGGLRLPAVPEPFSIVVPTGHAMGFTNPIYLDVNGNGMYDPPGTPLVD